MGAHVVQLIINKSDDLKETAEAGIAYFETMIIPGGGMQLYGCRNIDDNTVL